jgi:hypothetical protein
MTRTPLILALVANACITPALAQTPGAPRNDLPQSYTTIRDWGELPAGMKWAAVSSIEAAADGSIFDTIYVADSESGPDTGAHELTGIRKGIRIGSARDGRGCSRSSRTWYRPPRIIPAPRAWALMRRATSMAPWCGARCWSGM